MLEDGRSIALVAEVVRLSRQTALRYENAFLAQRKNSLWGLATWSRDQLSLPAHAVPALPSSNIRHHCTAMVAPLWRRECRLSNLLQCIVVLGYTPTLMEMAYLR